MRISDWSSDVCSSDLVAPDLIQAFNAAQSAASAAGQAAPAQLQLIQTGAAYVGLQHETLRAFGAIHSVDVAGRADDALAVATALDAVVKVVGRGQQGGVSGFERASGGAHVWEYR